MENSALKGLAAILSLLETNDEIKPVKRRRFKGSTQDDVVLGDIQDNVASGKGGRDALFGNAGNDRLDGDGGNDVLFGGDGDDSITGGAQRDTLSGDGGNDQLDGGNGNDFLDGGIGNDALVGGNGSDQLLGGDGIDTLTGGVESDQFMYSGNLFANGTPALAGQTGIRVLNTPDIITDYTIGEDQFVFDKVNLGINEISFQKGQASQIAANGNVIVLTDAFAAAGAAARAIANNNNITAKEGAFVYFNTTLGLTRVVYSNDLANGGDISVLANLDNQRGQSGLTNIANFSTTDFSVA